MKLLCRSSLHLFLRVSERRACQVLLTWFVAGNPEIALVSGCFLPSKDSSCACVSACVFVC